MRKFIPGLIALVVLSFVFTGCENGTTDTVYVGENLVPGIPITTAQGLNAALALKSDWTAANPETYALYSNADTIDYFGTAKYQPTITAAGVTQGQLTTIVPDGVILNLSGLFRVGDTTAAAGTLAIGGEVNIWKGAEIIAGTYSSLVAGTNSNGIIVIGVATVDTEDVTPVGAATQVKYPKRNARGRLNIYENGALTTSGFKGGTSNMDDVKFASVYAYNSWGHDQSEFINDEIAVFTADGGTYTWTRHPDTPEYPDTTSGREALLRGNSYFDPLNGKSIQNQMVVAAFGDGTITGSGKSDSSFIDNHVPDAPPETRLAFSANSYFNVGGTDSTSFLRLSGSSENARQIANGLFKTNLILPSTMVNIADLTVREGTKAYVAGKLTGNLTVNGTLLAGTDAASGGGIGVAEFNTDLFGINVGPKGYLDATGVGDLPVQTAIELNPQFMALKDLKVQKDNLSFGYFIANGSTANFRVLESLEIDGHVEINQGKFPVLNSLVVNGNNSLYTGGAGTRTAKVTTLTTQFYALKSLTVNGYYNAGTGTDFTSKDLEGVQNDSNNEALTSLTIGNGGYLYADGANLMATEGKYLSNFDKVTSLNVNGTVPSAYIRGFGPKRATFPEGYPGTGGIIATTTGTGIVQQAVYPDQRSDFGVIVSSSATFKGLGTGATLTIGGFAQLDNPDALTTVETLTVTGVLKSAAARLDNLKTVAINNGGYIYSGAASFGGVTAGAATGNGTLDLTGNTTANSKISILAGTGSIRKVIAIPSGGAIVITEVDIAGTDSPGTWSTNNTTIGNGGKIVLGNALDDPTVGTVGAGNTLTIGNGGNLTVTGNTTLDVSDTGVIAINEGGALTISSGTVTIGGGSTTNLTIGGTGGNIGVLTVSGPNSSFVADGAIVNINGGKVVVNNAGSVSLGGTVTLTGGALLDGIGGAGVANPNLDWLGTASTVTVNGQATIKGSYGGAKTVLVAADGYNRIAGEVGPFITLPAAGGSITIVGAAGTAGTITITAPGATLGALPGTDRLPASIVINSGVNVTGMVRLGGTNTISEITNAGAITGQPGAQLIIPTGGTLTVGGSFGLFAQGGTILTAAGTFTAATLNWSEFGTTGTYVWQQ